MEKKMFIWRMIRVSVGVAALLAFTGAAIAIGNPDGFYGFIKSRPEGKVGTWVVGGRSIEVTNETRLDDDHARLDVGACVEVHISEGKVKEVESEPDRKCRRRGDKENN